MNIVVGAFLRRGVHGTKNLIVVTTGPQRVYDMTLGGFKNPAVLSERTHRFKTLEVGKDLKGYRSWYIGLFFRPLSEVNLKNSGEKWRSFFSTRTNWQSIRRPFCIFRTLGKVII